MHTISNAETIQAFVSTATALVDEARLHYDEEGFEITAVDPANVGMVTETMSKDAFVSYDPGAEGGILGVNLTRLQDVVNLADDDDHVSLSLDVETRKLSVEHGGFDYTLALLDPESVRSEPDLPDLDLPCKIPVEWARADRAIRAADMVSDHLSVGVDPDARVLVFDAAGDTDEVHVEIEEEDFEDGAVIDGEASSLLSIDYLKDIRRAIPNDAVATIHVGMEFPVQIEWEFHDGDAWGMFMVAPRIQRD